MNVPIWIESTGDYPIYAEIYTCDVLNPNAGDLLNGIVGHFQGSFGDGTNSPPGQLITVGDPTAVDKYTIIYVGNWNFDSTTGNFTLKLVMPWTVNSLDDYNTGSSTIITTGDSVADTQYAVQNNGVSIFTVHPDMQPSIYARGSAIAQGQYFIGYRFRNHDTTLHDGGMGLVRNGIVQFPFGHFKSSSTSIQTYKACETTPRCNLIWIADGDTIEVRLFDQDVGVVTSPPYTATTWLEVLDFTFYPALGPGPNTWDTLDSDFTTQSQAAPNPATYNLPELSLGSVGALEQLGKGGEGTWPAHSVASGYETFDSNGRGITVMPNGDLYVAWCETLRTYPTPTATRYYSLWMKKWNGSSWSTISHDVWGNGDAAVPPLPTLTEGGLSMCNDGNDSIYIAWAERLPATAETYWRCMQYSISGDTFTELGPSTGTSHWPNMFSERMACAEESGGIRVRCSPAGVPWVAWVELSTIPWDSLDVFSGSATNLSGGTNGWNALGGGTPLARDGSGHAYSSSAGAEGASYRTDAPLNIEGSDLADAACIVSTLPNSGEYIELFIHLGSPGGSFDGYKAVYTVGVTNDTAEIFKITAGVATTIGGSVTLTGHPLASGDTLIFRRQAPASNNIVFYYDHPGNIAVQMVSRTDTTYTGNKQNIGLGVYGQNAQVDEFMGGNSTFQIGGGGGTDSSPFLYYWDGSSWVDSLLPAPPTRRTTGYSLSNFWEDPVIHLDFGFCHHDGPSEHPAAFYCIQWNYGGSPPDNTWEFVYFEYDGSSWGNNIQSRADLFLDGSKLIGGSQSSGNWCRGLSIFDNGTKPYFCAHLGYLNNSDKTAIWTIEDDGSAFLSSLTNPFPSESETGRFLAGGDSWGSADCVFLKDNTTIVLTSQQRIGTDFEDGGMSMMIMREGGNGRNWMSAFGKMSPTHEGWVSEGAFASINQMAIHNDTIYVFHETWDDIFGVWAITPAGNFTIVSMNWRSGQRNMNDQRVLVG
jgi:hypothetical protein